MDRTLFALLLASCSPNEAPPEVFVSPLPEAAPALVAPPAPPAAPEPEPLEYCDAEGWCRPYRVLPFVSAAATRSAVAVATSEGVVALWADGRWRGGFTAGEGSEVVGLARIDSVVQVLTCLAARCERREWTAEGFGPPEKASVPRAAPKATSRLGDWRIEYSTLIHADEEGAELRLRPTTALGGSQCATRFEMLGDAEAPFAVCTQHTSRSLHHVEGGRLVTLVEPWATTWVNAGAAVHHGAGCEPCLVTVDGVLSFYDRRWEVVPMSTEASAASIRYDIPPEMAIARDGGHLSLLLGDRVWTWSDAWASTSRIGPWARRISSFAWGTTGSLAYPTPDALVVLGGGNQFEFRPWRSHLPEGAARAGFAYVHDVAADDILNVRAGPHAASASLAELAPDARCVRLLESTSRLAGRSWQAIELPDGRRGWVNASYVRPDPDCDPFRE